MSDKDHAYKITVLTGLNAGYEAGLPGSRISMGGLEGNSVQLDGIDDQIAEFSSKKGRLKVRPSVEGVIVNGDIHCKQGHTSEFELPARIQLTEDTSVFFEGLNRSHHGLSPAGRTGIATAAFGAALFLSPIGVNLEYSTSATATAIDGEGTLEARQSSRAVAGQLGQANNTSRRPAEQAFAPITCENCASEAAEFLQTSFERPELIGLVASAADGTVRVKGKINEEHRVVWDAVRMSFDQKFAGSVPLLPSITTVVEGEAPFAVATVWLGETREVTTLDGATYFLGQSVEDDWTVSAIEDSFVELERGDKVLRIRF